MNRLVAELNEQFAESAKLEKAIKANLKGLGYGRLNSGCELSSQKRSSASVWNSSSTIVGRRRKNSVRIGSIVEFRPSLRKTSTEAALWLPKKSGTYLTKSINAG